MSQQSFIGSIDPRCLLEHLISARLDAEFAARDALNLVVEKQAIIAGLESEIERLQLIVDQKRAERAEIAANAASEIEEPTPVEPDEQTLADEPTRRSLNPSGRNSDPAVYKLRNLDGRSVRGTQVELRRKLGVSPPTFYQLLNTPGRVSRDGWYRPTARATRAATAGGRKPDPTVYQIQNLDGATFSGTRREIVEKIGASLPTAVRMLKTRGYATAGGWSLKSASRAGE